MEIDDIEIGKFYWSRDIGRAKVCRVIDKTEDRILVVYNLHKTSFRECHVEHPGWILCEAKEPESKPKTFWQWLFGC